MFGWSNKRIHCHCFWVIFINLEIEIGVNLQILRGQFVISELFWGKFEIFEKFEDQNVKFEKNIRIKKLQFFSFLMLFEIL